MHGMMRCGDTINEQAVRILLECILVTTCRLHRCESGPCILRNFEKVHINWCQFDIFA